MNVYDKTYYFGKVSFTVKGLSIFVPAANFADKFKGLSRIEEQQANADAIRLLRDAQKRMDRYKDISKYGMEPHDLARRDYEVARSVYSLTRQTFKR